LTQAFDELDRELLADCPQCLSPLSWAFRRQPASPTPIDDLDKRRANL